jgi:DNA (cytosine-5)-methyltransferase 1
MNELALFAGAGGGILGGLLLGWRTVAAVEVDRFARRILLARQNDGTLAAFPVWDDVRTFDGRPWRGIVDVVSGGFPCQDISSAGKRAGITGSKSVLWSDFARIIGEVGPRFVFVENSPNLVNNGLDVVLRDLDALGFDARWGVLGAHHAGAPHKRERLWIVANSNRQGQLQRGGSMGAIRGRPVDSSQPNRIAPWPPEPSVRRVAHGVAHWDDRLRALGNGQVPRVAALAWSTLSTEDTCPGRALTPGDLARVAPATNLHQPLPGQPAPDHDRRVAPSRDGSNPFPR